MINIKSTILLSTDQGSTHHHKESQLCLKLNSDSVTHTTILSKMWKWDWTYVTLITLINQIIQYLMQVANSYQQRINS